MTTKQVRVGDVLHLERRPVDVDPAAEYREVGVRSFGKGLFHKEPVTGVELGSKRVFRIEPGDLVISNVFAWEGAIALATQAEAGMIGSHRFMTYVPKDERIDASWAAWFFLSEPGLELIRVASPGSAGRNKTLAIDRFESLEIPLPPPDEQRAIANELSAIRELSLGLARRAARSAELAQAAQHSMVDAFLMSGLQSGWSSRPLSDVATINPRPTRLDAGDSVAFVPMAAVDAVRGTVADPETRSAGEIGPGYKQFKVGDVIFARITPCMQNGKCAVFDGPQNYGYGSTEFHVVRAGQEVDPRWLHRVMRSSGFRRQAAERFKGTAGQQRVPADFLRTVSIPVPPVGAQEQAIRELDRIEASGLSLASMRAEAQRLISALSPAALNRVFGSLA